MSAARVIPLRPEPTTPVVDLVIEVRSADELEAVLLGLLDEIRRSRAGMPPLVEGLS